MLPTVASLWRCHTLRGLTFGEGGPGEWDSWLHATSETNLGGAILTGRTEEG